MPMVAVFGDRQTHDALIDQKEFRRNGQQVTLIANFYLIPCHSFFVPPTPKPVRNSGCSAFDLPHQAIRFADKHLALMAREIPLVFPVVNSSEA